MEEKKAKERRRLKNDKMLREKFFSREDKKDELKNIKEGTEGAKKSNSNGKSKSKRKRKRKRKSKRNPNQERNPKTHKKVDNYQERVWRGNIYVGVALG